MPVIQVSMVVADGLVPVWYQDISNIHDDVDCWLCIKSAQMSWADLKADQLVKADTLP